MRISRRPPTTISSLGETAPAADTPEPTGRAGGGAVTDRVQLSEAARLRQRLKTEVGDPAAVASDRVQALQEQIASQTYAPSPHAVADRLLRELTADLLA